MRKCQTDLTRLGFICLSLIVVACGSGQGASSQTAEPAPRAEVKKDYDQLLRAAQSYAKAGKPSRAAETAQRAINQKPEAPEGYRWLGLALAMMEKLTESLAAYEKARQLGSRDRELFDELASIYDVTGRYADAIAVYEDYLTDHPEDAETHHQLGFSLLGKGEVGRGVESLREAHRLAPNDLLIRMNFGFGLLQAKLLDEAAGHFQAVIDADSENEYPIAIQFLAQVRAAQGNLEEALTLLDRAIAAKSDDPRPVRLRAQLNRIMGDNEAALRDYQMLVKADPQDAAALLGAAGALIALERLGEAKTAVDRAKGIVGEAPQIAFRLAQIAWRQGDKSAVTVLEKFAEDHPGVIEAWRELVAAAKGTGNKKLEKKALAKVKELGKK